MQLFIKFLSVMFGIVLITALHIGSAYLLPYPISFINILFMIIILLLLIFESGAIVWIAFFTHYIIELYTTTTPFGIILFSSTISILFAIWLQQRILTNRSWYAGTALTILVLIIYRTLYSVTLVLTQEFVEKSEIVWNKLLPVFMWELIFTSLGVGIIFFILSKFWPKLKGATVERSLASFFRSI